MLNKTVLFLVFLILSEAIPVIKPPPQAMKPTAVRRPAKPGKPVTEPVSSPKARSGAMVSGSLAGAGLAIGLLDLVIEIIQYYVNKQKSDSVAVVDIEEEPNVQLLDPFFPVTLHIAATETLFKREEWTPEAIFNVSANALEKNKIEKICIISKNLTSFCLN